MRRFIVSTLILIVLILFIPRSISAHSISGSVTTLHMTEKGYTPRNITIREGDTVSFENTGKNELWPASNIHPSHEIYPAFDPKKVVKPGETWSFTFTKAGVWRYHDHIYPEITGSITVVGTKKTGNTITLFGVLKNVFYGLANRSGIPLQQKNIFSYC